MMQVLRRGLAAALVLGGLAAPALAQSNDPSFRVNNRSGVTINEIYVSSSNDNSWGPDRLGANVLAPGQTLVVRLPQAQCINDIRIVYANGQVHERRRVDTCQITDYNMQ
ncbi:hypothetical protein [Falsiroseomonas oryziterrae]|uniref:hypothetical protein n=1 Tax=Falsiroseomonas oryziterrae TaxID=2911368 RepID=UPI001F429653|nr:hypothetical protein [Roseomonas sp. NPKOSM-4]